VVLIPARHPLVEAQEMLVSFDVDCGELLPGHRVVARGLSTQLFPHPHDVATAFNSAADIVNDRGPRNFLHNFVFPIGSRFADDDGSEQANVWRRSRRRTELMAAARRVPGFSFWYELVPGVTQAELDEDGYFDYMVDIDYRAERPLEWGACGDGEMEAPAEGGASTPCAQGPWPLPENPELLTFTITGFDAVTGFPKDTANGTLTVDLAPGNANWTPETSA
jgi:hypothetical protein